MGNSVLKERVEKATKTGVLAVGPDKLKKIPKSFTKLHQPLRTLDISHNSIRSIPSSISKFTNLKVLIADKNKVVNVSEGIGSLSKLEHISLCDNVLTNLPQSLAELQNLRKIFLMNNKISKFPLMLCGLVQLDVVDLTGNEIVEVPDGVRDLFVIELILRNNKITTISEYIANCPRLKVLRLENNRLSLESFPKRLLPISHVCVVTAEGNCFEESKFKELPGYDKFLERNLAMRLKRL